jgi:hypothetical protein
MEPADGDVHYNLALSLMYTNKLTEAIHSFSRATQLDTTNAYAYNNLGEAMRKSGQVRTSPILHLRDIGLMDVTNTTTEQQWRCFDGGGGGGGNGDGDGVTDGQLCRYIHRSKTTRKQSSSMRAKDRFTTTLDLHTHKPINCHWQSATMNRQWNSSQPMPISAATLPILS